jgi:hypothetical protein
MGSGASASIEAGALSAEDGTLEQAFAKVSPDAKAKILAALQASEDKSLPGLPMPIPKDATNDEVVVCPISILRQNSHYKVTPEAVEEAKKGDESKTKEALITDLNDLSVEELKAVVEAMTAALKEGGPDGGFPKLDELNKNTYPNVELRNIMDFFNPSVRPGYEPAEGAFKEFHQAMGGCREG